MANQKDRHLEAPGEANRDKHINFAAIENGDVDPATENYNKDDNDETSGEDNGFFTDDDKSIQTKEKYNEDENESLNKNEKATPNQHGTTSSTSADKINITANNKDLVMPVKNNDTKPYINEDDQAH